jgi:DNA adenine methylase Dam
LFPEQINIFVDLFGGGCNVGINANAKKVVYNEKQTPIYELFKGIYETDSSRIVELVESVIQKYNGVSTKEDYLQLRVDYNNTKEWFLLFVLSCFSYNYSLRFNSKGGFNMPSGVGINSYNDSIKNRLQTFTERIHSLQMNFVNKDFRSLKFEKLSSNDFVYCDPPYLISTASYNENGGWTEEDERDLHKLLDNLNKNNIKFALSNVIVHKGNKNEILIEWAEKYNTYALNMKYDTKWRATRKVDDIPKETIEVLITNYK